MEAYKIIADDNRAYPMGLTVEEGRIHVSAANDGKECSLVIFEPGKVEPQCRIPMPKEQQLGDVWNLTVEGLDPEALEYCFEVDGKLVSDSYGRAFCGRETWAKAEGVGSVLKTPMGQNSFEWEGDAPLGLPYEDMILYRVHIRGLTKHPSSKVSDKGTFKGMIQKIPYLNDLGITAVELMPVNEFQEVMMSGGAAGNPYDKPEPTGRINYWGYTDGFRCAPKASFASGKEKHQVLEFKTLVKELHKAGIEVVIELYFDGTEHPAFVLDVLRFWVREYHVDGIHLVGTAPIDLIGRDPYLSRTKLFAASWGGTGAETRKHLAEYNDGFLIDMRRVLKGDEDQMNCLVLRSRQNPFPCGTINYMANSNGFTMMDMVSYDIKHNEANGEKNQDGTSGNYSWNCGVEGPTKKKKILELRKKQIRNAYLLLFLSQGTPLLLSGDEFGNSKGGNNNSYCQDNETSWLNWNQLKTNQDIYEFTKAIIAFRRNHPVFHMEQEPRVMDYLACGHPDVSYHGVKAWCPEFENFRRQLGIMYCGNYGKRADGTPDDFFFVAYNMHWEPHEFALPNLPKTMKWHLAINTDDNEVNGIYQEGKELPIKNQKQYPVAPRAIVVFIGK